MNSELKKKILRVGIIGLFFLSIVSLQGITDLREAQQTVFMLALVSLFSLLLRNIWITLFVIWTVFLYSFFKFSSGSVYLTNIFLGAILYYITKLSFKKSDADFLITGLMWLVVLNVGYSVFQALGYDFIFSKIVLDEPVETYRKNVATHGFMNADSITACLYAMSIPLFATRGTKLGWVAAVGMLFPLYLQKTALCFVIGMAGLIFVMFFRMKRIFWVGIVSICLLLGSFYLNKVDGFGNERFPQWYRSLKDCVIHPITGWGLDSYRNFTPTKPFRYMQARQTWATGTEIVFKNKVYQSPERIFYWDNPHSLYISLVYEFGIVGLIIFIGYLRGLFLGFRYAPKHGNIIGLLGFILVFLGVSIAHFPIFLARVAVLIVPAFAMFEVLTEDKDG